MQRLGHFDVFLLEIMSATQSAITESWLRAYSCTCLIYFACITPTGSCPSNHWLRIVDMPNALLPYRLLLYLQTVHVVRTTTIYFT